MPRIPELAFHPGRFHASLLLGMFLTVFFVAVLPPVHAQEEETKFYPLMKAGRWQEALEAAQRELARAENEAEIIVVSGFLGEIHLELGQPEAAIPYLEKALPYIQREIAPEGDYACKLLMLLARSHQLAGNKEEAIRRYGEFLAIMEKHFGRENDVYRTIAAQIRQLEGESIESEGELPQNAMLRAQVLLERATALQNEFRYRESITPAEEAYELSRQTGPDRDSAEATTPWLSAAVLANAYYGIGEVEKALPLFEESLAKASTIVEPTNETLVNHRIKFGICLVLENGPGQAVEILKASNDALQAAGVELADPRRTATLLALSQAMSHQRESAGKLTREFLMAMARMVKEGMLPAVRAHYGETSSATMAALHLEARSRLAAGEQLRGEKLLHQTSPYDVWAKEEGMLHPDGFRVHEFLMMPGEGEATGLIAQAQRGESDQSQLEEWLRQGLAELDGFWGGSHPWTRLARENLALTLAMRGQLEVAQVERRQIIEGIEKMVGTESAALILPLIELANVQRKAGELGEAEKSLERARQLAEVAGTEGEKRRLSREFLSFYVLLQDWEAARKYGEEFLGYAPLEPEEIEGLMGVLGIPDGPREAALAELERMQKQMDDPSLALEIMLTKASLLVGSEDSQELEKQARQILREAEVLDPLKSWLARGRGQLLLGMSLFRMGRFTEAIEAFQAGYAILDERDFGPLWADSERPTFALALAKSGQEEKAATVAARAYDAAKARWEQTWVGECSPHASERGSAIAKSCAPSIPH